MVVSLQSRAPLPLGRDDKGVQELVELAEIEQPAPEGETLVPHAANIGGVRSSVWQQVDDGVLDLPGSGGRVEGDGVTQTARTVYLAERVGHTGQSVGVVEAGPDTIRSPRQGSKGDGRVEGQEDVVQHDKDLEGASLCNPPRFVSIANIVRVD